MVPKMISVQFVFLSIWWYFLCVLCVVLKSANQALSLSRPLNGAPQSRTAILLECGSMQTSMTVVGADPWEIRNSRNGGAMPAQTNARCGVMP